MSSDDLPPKPMPSADEIAAYLEVSAARTRKRLTLAKAAPVSAAPAPAKRALRVERGPVALRDAEASGAEAGRPAPGAEGVEPWQPPPEERK